VTRTLAVAALVLAAPLASASPTVDGVLAKLESSSQSLSTLQGDFTQRNRLKLFKQELKSRGLLRFKPPRQIRWEYVDPDPSTLVLDGSKATLTTPGQPAQVFDLDKDATMRAVFDQLLTWFQPSGLKAAAHDYELATSGTDAAPVLTLSPKASSPVARAFSRIELRLAGDTMLMRSILLIEKNGDEKEISFGKLTRNAPLPPAAFTP
jgi:outer membrane lipoprotein-sorting protein